MPEQAELALAEQKEKPHYTGHRARLRERFLKSPDAVADYELLEIILFPARPVGDVKPLAKALMARFSTLANVLKAEDTELAAVEGVNASAIAAIRAVAVAGARMLRQEVEKRPVIQSWASLLDYCRLTLSHKKHEEFHVLFLDRKFALLTDEMQKGTVDQAPVYPREVVKRALDHNAAAVILAHNHPSGRAEPSAADVALTAALKQALALVDVRLLDHFIVATGMAPLSLAETGRL